MKRKVGSDLADSIQLCFSLAAVNMLCDCGPVTHLSMPQLPYLPNERVG